MIFSTDLILHNECSCLLADGIHDPNCDKLFIRLFHPEEDKYLNFGICRNKIRSEYHKQRLENEKRGVRFGYYDNRRYEINKIISELTNDFFDFEFDNNFYPPSGNDNDLLERKVRISTCTRPWWCKDYAVRDAISLCLKNNKYNGQMSEELKSVISNYLHNPPYKKYVTRYKECIRFLKKMNVNNENEWIELFSEILKLKKI